MSVDAATLHDAVRLAVQSAAASVAAYFALRWVGSEEFFVGILSAVMILQPSIGGTLEAARTRLSAALLGSAIGFACLVALPDAWGVAVGLLLAIFVLNGLAVIRPAWSYGVVAAVGLSIATSDALVEAAVARLLAIGLGASVGLLVSAVLWHETAGARFERHLTRAVRHLGDALRAVLAKAGQARPDDAIDGRPAIRSALAKARAACDAMHMAETGPRRGRLDAVQSAFDSIWLLDAVMERTRDLGAGGLDAPLDAFRDAGLRVIDGLAGDDMPVDAVPALDAAFERLARDLSARDLPDPRGCDQAEVIAFATGSIRDRLADLARARRERPVPRPGWAARVTKRRARP